MLRLIALIFLSGVLLATPAAAQQPDIHWRMKNPFRLLTGSEVLEMHRKAFEVWSPSKGGPVFSAEAVEIPKQLAGFPNRGWSERALYPTLANAGDKTSVVARPVQGATCFNQTTHRYDACDKGNPEGGYAHPTSHRIEVWLGSPDGPVATDQKCRWSVKPVNANVSASLPVDELCGRRVEVPLQYPGGGTILLSVDGSAPTHTLFAKGIDVLIVGMGDSFAAGEGNPDSPVRLSATNSDFYSQYLPTFKDDGKAWCALRGWKDSCASDYTLGGYPTRNGTRTNHSSDDKYETDQGKFDSGVGDKSSWDAFYRRRAEWLSTSCHRSLYSYQARTALQLAVEDPHRAVTFVSYACTGAEVLGGLMLPELFRFDREIVGQQYSNSQLNSIEDTLCQTATVKDGQWVPGLKRASASVWNADKGDYQSVADIKAKAPHFVPRRCAEGKRRIADLLLLSIGVNDTQFVPLLAGVLMLENEDIVSALLDATGEARTVEASFLKKYVRELLPSRLALVAPHLERLVRKPDDVNKGKNPNTRIMHAAYPQMLYDESGKFCSGATDPTGIRKPMLAGMDLSPMFTFDDELAKQTQLYVENQGELGLYGAMKANAAERGWTFVDGYVADGSFKRHGICALGPDETEKSLRLPRCIYKNPNLGTEGVCRETGWSWNKSADPTINPSQFAPYARTHRWFRTVNDAFLTTHFQPKPGAQIAGAKLKPSWRLAASGIWSGAFHPNALGHAVVADSHVKSARCSLLADGLVSPAGKRRAELFAHCGR